MKIPIYHLFYPRRRRNFQYIVLHDINCTVAKLTNRFNEDTGITLLPKYREFMYRIYSLFEIPFHYVIEKIYDDYEVFNALPLYSICRADFFDLPNDYDHAVHILFLGNCNFFVPDRRLYKVLAYRVIVPLIRIFRIPSGNIYLHSELDTKMDCPGVGFDKIVLTQFVQSWKQLG